jgi:hypothetical protein
MEDLPLRDIHLPQPIGWWPPAIGWWLLVVLVPLLIAALIWLTRRARRMTPAKLALCELDRLQADEITSPQEKAATLSALLRRVAITLFPRQEVAGLAGDEWLRWLDQFMGKPLFSEGPGRGLIEAPYQPIGAVDAEVLAIICREWLQNLAKSKIGKGR